MHSEPIYAGDAKTKVMPVDSADGRLTARCAIGMMGQGWTKGRGDRMKRREKIRRTPRRSINKLEFIITPSLCEFFTVSGCSLYLYNSNKVLLHGLSQIHDGMAINLMPGDSINYTLPPIVCESLNLKRGSKYYFELVLSDYRNNHNSSGLIKFFTY